MRKYNIFLCLRSWFQNWGVFNILYEQDAIATRKCDEQLSLGVGIIATVTPWLIKLIYVF